MLALDRVGLQRGQLREAQVEASGAPDWNRIVLFIWPDVEAPILDLAGVARRLAPMTFGAGLEQVLRRAHRAGRFAISFAMARNDTDAEVIREAALLHDFAELLLWCHAPTLALEIGPKTWWPSKLAREERGYDEEFLLAALLHDVGKAIDPRDHVVAALQSLEGTITERTETLIALHMDALAYRDGTLGARARGRLEQSEEFDDIMLLRELDSRGRVPGAEVCDLAEALAYIKNLATEFDD